MIPHLLALLVRSLSLLVVKFLVRSGVVTCAAVAQGAKTLDLNETGAAESHIHTSYLVV